MLEIRISDLLSDILHLDIKQDCLITGLTLDSRTVKSGDLFLACICQEADGRDFIIDAINRGVAAVLCEDRLPSITLPKDIPIIVVADLRWKIGLIGAKFYGYPAEKLTMIGVTGTNGKTSITQYIATVLTKLGYPCAVIGTIGTGFPGKLNFAVNTTPDPLTLQRLLFEFVAVGAKAVAMEVSSQGLAQGRVSGVAFTIAVLTNLTRDHLDYHGTMENYGEAKRMLFSQGKLQQAVVNIDDEFGRGLIQELKTTLEVYAYTIAGETLAGVPTIGASNIEIKSSLMAAQVTTPWGAGTLRSKLLGRFNLSNLLAVLGVLGIMQVNLEDALVEIANLEAANGRMQVFGGEHKKPLVVIDYAHTPDALEQSLLTLQEYCRGALWCVFGCGGDRDRGKRHLMGKIAERLSDHVVITNDNPRTENSKQIVDDILQGLLCPWAVEVEYDRATSIAYAINQARENDVILIAGKGHEDYQIIGKEKTPFSDKEIVTKALVAKVM